ncbi:MAG TPA: PilT/PilU family type 4a pilus ATPase [Candidatus Polarisedimenticolaceae bacterium]|nr:PilT/PilU family type 4a pilus ATPase [Candidatus Polarisedimenticolaceae bacterium]
MATFDQELSRLVKELNALGGGVSLPAIERDPAGRLQLDRLLGRVIESAGSDLLLVAGVPPTARVDGRLIAIDPQVLDARAVRALVVEMLDESLQRRLDADRAVDFCFDRPGLGRFRCNAHFQRGSVAAAVRVFPSRIPTLEELNLPAALARFAALERGLVLIAGPAGCGKSTTLAALIDTINRTRNVHIVTAEDPIEYRHAHGTSIVEQMEVGRDVRSFEEALRAALRQDPDVLLVGEMRDIETMAMTLTAAETGHLVFSTLHTGTVAQTLDRIVDVFPEDRQAQTRAQLALSLAGIVIQTLVPRREGRGRLPAVEVMVVTDAMRNLIRRGLNHQIHAQMALARGAGTATLDESLARLVKSGSVAREEAARRAVHHEEFESYLR